MGPGILSPVCSGPSGLCQVSPTAAALLQASIWHRLSSSFGWGFVYLPWSTWPHLPGRPHCSSMSAGFWPLPGQPHCSSMSAGFCLAQVVTTHFDVAACTRQGRPGGLVRKESHRPDLPGLAMPDYQGSPVEGCERQLVGLLPGQGTWGCSGQRSFVVRLTTWQAATGAALHPAAQATGLQLRQPMQPYWCLSLSGTCSPCSFSRVSASGVRRVCCYSESVAALSLGQSADVGRHAQSARRACTGIGQ